MDLPEFLKRDAHGAILLSGHRVSLDDVLHFYSEGYSPEMILGELPTLSLALIHKIIAFYLEHQAELDEHLAYELEEIDRQHSQAAEGPSLAELRQRMRSLRAAEPM